MDTLSASVEAIGKGHFLVIGDGTEDISIPLTDDSAVRVKKAFNRLIQRLRRGPVQIQLTEGRDDLFAQVAAEYVKQLNRELGEVRAEMVQHGLAEDVDQFQRSPSLPLEPG